jgi:hypothetical protein
VTAELGDAADYAEVEPLLRRMVDLDPAMLVRLRRDGARLTALVRTPFGVLAARSVQTTAVDEPIDVTVGAADVLAWMVDDSAAPAQRNAEWRAALPPQTGWQRIDQVPDEVIRNLVRSGALALKEAAEREGVPGAQPRAEVADALLDSVVLTVTSETTPLSAAVTLRVLSALTRLGFLARGSHAVVDRSGRWARVAGTYGTVYLETAPSGLSVLR